MHLNLSKPNRNRFHLPYPDEELSSDRRPAKLPGLKFRSDQTIFPFDRPRDYGVKPIVVVIVAMGIACSHWSTRQQVQCAVSTRFTSVSGWGTWRL
ncbi:hypothetical protein NPIL_115951 [Nephila pilipes]|uniref:Uncharacterized protein n=1 Tax=Nephila pilipes TaxID=299642 RepID=A0A8X6IQ11_NEPPI|nr:hypothetical protein NPIL_63731 [Nephila pilipes]GFT89996.1 hypothetical protein NPIL_115951 [Nephila pilipes]